MGRAKLIRDTEGAYVDGRVILIAGATTLNVLTKPTKRRTRPLTVKQKVAKAVQEEFDKMFDDAKINVKRALARGDKTVAMWFIDGYVKAKGTRIAAPMLSDITTEGGLRALSLEALTRASRGELPLEHLKALQDAVARQMMMEDSAVLVELKRELDQISTSVHAKTYSREHMPAWGRLKAVTEAPEAEQVDGDDDDVPRMNGHSHSLEDDDED
jgi:hypothetical protein